MLSHYIRNCRLTDFYLLDRSPSIVFCPNTEILSYLRFHYSWHHFSWNSEVFNIGNWCLLPYIFVEWGPPLILIGCSQNWTIQKQRYMHLCLFVISLLQILSYRTKGEEYTSPWSCPGVQIKQFNNSVCCCMGFENLSGIGRVDSATPPQPQFPLPEYQSEQNL